MRNQTIDNYVNTFVSYLGFQPANNDIKATIQAAQRFLADKSLERSTVQPTQAPVTRWLDQALESALAEPHDNDHLLSLCQATQAVLPCCPWTPGYDEKDVGSAFKQYFAYATLVGDGGIIPCSYFSTGITLIAPDFFYDWHHHPAIEIYLNLTPGSMWGINKAPLDEKKLGDIIIHPSQIAHAMHCEKAPILAPWLWAGDVNVPAKMC
ncbi:dimethylsulfonioproprionate lyase family protein [Aestuariibacter sp. A3R04]|uniref:dimethylsulfonioproprionate lyase family protein n=1 Tax=Aestuariibacter sp. A3R04 TaxID=2841571 RepID=UPI001C08757D|nr:dimethylsulfonioproprionate lyase family protein [Aestuariibacter sp. A3R04]MBU3021203.1 dimethylsulfoniopropionate lyase [Aestuariibacter sp. A3R04]